jgi:hypothetical protein
MSKIDFDAHMHLSMPNKRPDVHRAIELANKKAPQGHFVVCITYANDVLVLPEYTASVREDIAEVVYDNLTGYIFRAKTGAKK